MFLFFLGLCIGVIAGALFILLGDKMLDKYLPEETLRSCPPCDGNCNQGRNCPSQNK